MSGNTGLLTQRCDPFGMESGKWGEQLAGGVFDAKLAGKVKWYCKEPAAGRYRMVCRGGDYGHATAGNLVRSAFHCDGGHQGQVMALCQTHVRDFTVGPPAPGFTKRDLTPVGQVGGTKANEMCPACMWPPEARALQDQANALQDEMSLIMASPLRNLGLMTEMAARQRQFLVLEARQDVIRARLDELFASGRVHKCPLKLVEVS